MRAFFGPAIALRKSLFLADANALVAPMARLRGWLDVIDEERILPPAPASIRSWTRSMSTANRRLSGGSCGSRACAASYIGMETGDDDLLRWLVKPGAVTDVVEAVTTLKVGGRGSQRDRDDRHRRRPFCRSALYGTISALNAMPLGAGDIVYFSPFVDHPAPSMAGWPRPASVR